MLPFDQQHELSSLCKVFCEAARPYWIEVAPPGGQGAAALDPWVKSSLVEALGAFGRFRRQHPRRLFQIRLSPGVHETGFTSILIRCRAFSDLRRKLPWSETEPRRARTKQWDGLHVQLLSLWLAVLPA